MWTDGYADKPSAMTDTGSDGLDWRITLKTFICFQFGIVTLLVALGIFHYTYAAIFGPTLFMKLTSAFDVDVENSIPTVFSVINLLCSSILLFVIYSHSKIRAERKAFYWLILSLIFLFLCFDEGASFHERLSGFGLFRGTFLGPRWIVYGALFSLAVFLFFIPFLWRLDRRTAALFVLSGAIFLSGALGFEYFGGYPARFEKDFANLANRILEDGCEMYGIALFNCTLFSRIVARNIFVIIGSKPSTSATV
jgi:hypothetical protein